MEKSSFWIKMGSYFADITLEEDMSEYSGKLEVICRKGRYALCTENAVYSYDDLYVNFRESFQRIDLEQYNIKNVLVLGLGLGSIPLLLEKNFNKKYAYTLIEIDEKIVNLAKKYTLNKLESPLEVICADALDYVATCPKTFDLVAIDIFIDDQIPTSFESLQFLENIKRVLSPNALLMYNRLSYNEHLESKTLHFFETKFAKVFEKAAILPLRGNKMLLNEKRLK